MPRLVTLQSMSVRIVAKDISFALLLVNKQGSYLLTNWGSVISSQSLKSECKGMEGNTAKCI